MLAQLLLRVGLARRLQRSGPLVPAWDAPGLARADTQGQCPLRIREDEAAVGAALKRCATAVERAALRRSLGVVLALIVDESAVVKDEVPSVPLVEHIADRGAHAAARVS